MHVFDYKLNSKYNIALRTLLTQELLIYAIYRYKPK